jgi:hypothetical protein
VRSPALNTPNRVVESDRAELNDHLISASLIQTRGKTGIGEVHN